MAPLRFLTAQRFSTQPPDELKSYAHGETLTYTVTLENGETYTATLYVQVYGPWDYPTYTFPLPTPEEPIDTEEIIETTQSPTTRTENSAHDINGDGETSPIDALLIINYLNDQSVRIKAGETIAAMSESNSAMDTSKDGEISPIDVLLIINALNANAQNVNAQNANAALQASGEAAAELSSNSVSEETQANDVAIMAVLAATNLDEDLRRQSRRTGSV